MLVGLIAPAYAVAVASMSGAQEAGCPTPRQVADALEARAPGTVAPEAALLPADGLRLLVESTPGVPLVRIELGGSAGDIRLRRELPAPEQDCAALADTVALIVQRYLIQIGYEGPGPPAVPTDAGTAPPPPRARPPIAASAVAAGGREAPAMDADLRAAASLRGGTEGGSDVEASLGIGVVAGRVHASLMAGLAAPRSASVAEGTARLWRFAIRAHAHAPFRAGVGQIEPGAGLGMDVVHVATDGLARNQSVVQLAPALEGGAAYRWPRRRRGFLRLGAWVGYSPVGYDFVVAGAPEPAFRTPAFYLRVGLEAGLGFRMTESPPVPP